MTAVSGKQLAVGMRYAVGFELDASGYPAATSPTVAYEGLEFGGAKALDLTIPDSRKITHVGNDRVLALDYLPPAEAPSGILHIARSEQDLNAKIMNVKKFTIAESTLVPWQTDQQGSEINIGMLTFQQSLDASLKLRRYRYFIMPSVRVIPKLSGMGENAVEYQYALAPNPVTQHLWGTALAVGTEGATEASVMEGMAEGKPKIIAYKADGIATVFTFPTGFVATSTAKIKVWNNGVAIVPDASTTSSITITVAPVADHLIVIYFEYV